MSEIVYIVKDYKLGQFCWCLGCGDYVFLNFLYKVMVELGVVLYNIVVIFGIGCFFCLFYYVNIYGFYIIYGCVVVVVIGVKVVNLDLIIW